MTEFLFANQYFCVALTVCAYALGAAIQRKWKLAILNPIVISAGLIIALLSALGVSNATYQEGCRVLNYLLTPATICLAISFYEQFKAMRQHLVAIFLGVILGSVCCVGSIYIAGKLFGFDRVMILSLLPKSITNAIGVALSTEIGGIAAITTAGIAVTGTFGNIAGAAICRLFRIEHPIAMGVAFGTASHVIGTAKAGELHQLAGAVGSFSMTTAGLLTALSLSFLSQYI